MELFNVWDDESYAEVRETMLRLLEKKMAEIGDVPAHPLGLTAKEIAAMYVPGANIAERANQRNI
jgi:hypothetical protein